MASPFDSIGPYVDRVIAPQFGALGDPLLNWDFARSCLYEVLGGTTTWTQRWPKADLADFVQIMALSYERFPIYFDMVRPVAWNNPDAPAVFRQAIRHVHRRAQSPDAPPHLSGFPGAMALQLVYESWRNRTIPVVGLIQILAAEWAIDDWTPYVNAPHAVASVWGMSFDSYH